jgi:N-acyl-L-homoserine lactone synthetase
MNHISFNLAQLHQYGSAFYDFLGLRKRFFVDQLGWDIPHDDDVEMDQYDNPTAFYSLVLRKGRVIAGIRAMPTTATWGSHTYMLRDAVAGKLGGIPSTIINKVAVSPNVWEATRVVISDEVTTQADRSLCLSLILDGVVDEAKSKGATEIMALCPPSFARTLRKIGYGAHLIGEPYVNAHDGRRYVAMSMPAERKMPLVAKISAVAKAAHAAKATHLSQPQPVHAPSVI